MKLHQLHGIQFLLANLLYAGEHGVPSSIGPGRGCILADAMGLGKTLQVLCALHLFVDRWMRDRGRSATERPRVLIVCPATVVSVWVNEVKVMTDWLVEAGETPRVAVPDVVGADVRDGCIWYMLRSREFDGDASREADLVLEATECAHDVESSLSWVVS